MSNLKYEVDDIVVINNNSDKIVIKSIICCFEFIIMYLKALLNSLFFNKYMLNSIEK